MSGAALGFLVCGVPWPAGAASTPLAALPPLPAACAAPESFTATEEKLTHVADALRPGGTLDILAIGSASTVDPAAGGGREGTSFPHRMAEALRAAAPAARVTLEVRGGRGMAASDMLAVLREALGKGHYQLVLWQTGTVEAVRNLPPDEFLDTLTEGAAAVAQADADLVLIDPQFSRFLRAHANVDPYEEVMQQVAGLPGVVLFRRYALMQAWAEDDGIDLERTPKAERKQAVDMLHACLGGFLARFVLSGLADPS